MCLKSDLKNYGVLWQKRGLLWRSYGLPAPQVSWSFFCMVGFSEMDFFLPSVQLSAFFFFFVSFTFQFCPTFSFCKNFYSLFVFGLHPWSKMPCVQEKDMNIFHYCASTWGKYQGKKLHRIQFPLYITSVNFLKAQRPCTYIIDSSKLLILLIQLCKDLCKQLSILKWRYDLHDFISIDDISEFKWSQWYQM